MKKVMYAAVAALVLATSSASAETRAESLVRQIAKQHRVPVKLAVAVCHVESGCVCNAPRGSRGEIGPMQVLPATAREVGVHSMNSCEKKVKAGVRYLKEALNRGGLWKYNQGIYSKRRSQAGANYERKVLAKSN